MESESQPSREKINLFEKFIKDELGVNSLEEVTHAIEENNWYFKIRPHEFWGKITEYFGQPINPDDLVNILTGGKTPEQVKQSLREKKWPFTISEDQMRKSVRETVYNE